MVSNTCTSISGFCAYKYRSIKCSIHYTFTYITWILLALKSTKFSVCLYYVVYEGWKEYTINYLLHATVITKIAYT